MFNYKIILVTIYEGNKITIKLMTYLITDVVMLYKRLHFFQIRTDSN